MIYFTSDLHLGHNAIISMQKRPFDNLAQMNETIISNYNSVVHCNDTVFFLGDICHRLKVDSANELISKMKGRKYLLTGNHDKKYDRSLFEDVKEFMDVSLNGQSFVLMHYPMLSWPKKNKGSIQLHGHIHSDVSSNLQNKKNGIYRYDVGVDANGFKPVSLEDIISFFEPGIK